MLDCSAAQIMILMLEFHGLTSHVLTLARAVHNQRSGQVHAMPITHNQNSYFQRVQIEVCVIVMCSSGVQFDVTI